MDKADLQVDQAMVVIAGVHARRRYDGRVAKVARKYVTIEYWRSSGNTTTLEFDIATQKERGNDGYYAAVFRTPEAQDRIDRETAVRDTLKEFGVVTTYAGPTKRRILTLAEMEAIVELLRGMDAAQADQDR